MYRFVFFLVPFRFFFSSLVPRNVTKKTRYTVNVLGTPLCRVLPLTVPSFFDLLPPAVISSVFGEKKCTEKTTRYIPMYHGFFYPADEALRKVSDFETSFSTSPGTEMAILAKILLPPQVTKKNSEHRYVPKKNDEKNVPKKNSVHTDVPSFLPNSRYMYMYHRTAQCTEFSHMTKPLTLTQRKHATWGGTEFCITRLPHIFFVFRRLPAAPQNPVL